MIEIRNLTKTLNGRKVLDDVNLDVNSGDALSIIGQSGCGKSVLLKHIIGLMKPDSGSIKIDGEDIVSAKESRVYEIRKKIAMVFQTAALFDSMNVFDNVAFGLFEHRRFSESEIARIVYEKLALVNLSNTEKMLPAELSGGMRKRVGIARAAAMAPKILLYDEPTTGLDPITSDVINNLIADTNKKLNVTSIIVTHDMKSAYKISNRIAMLYKGRIEGVDSAEKIQNTNNPVIHQFINGLAEGPITDEV